MDIKGLDKVVLLEKMWKGMKPASFFSRSRTTAPSFNKEAATQAVKKYIDYFQGRCIKTDLSGDTASPRLYDRDTYQGAMEDIVKSMRKNKVFL